MRRLFVTSIVGIALMWSAASFANEDFEVAFQRGVKLYQAEEFQEAASHYQAILDAGYESKALYFNLGNSYYKSGQLGSALWALERAKLLGPRDRDIAWNLGLVRKQLRDEEDNESVLSLFLHKLDFVTSNEISIAFLSLLTMLCMTSVLLAFKPGWKVMLRPINALGLSFLIIVSLVMSIRWVESQHPFGIIKDREVYVRYGPASNNTKAFLLHEGTKVSIQKESGSWYFIRFGGTKSGWLPRESVLKIHP